MAYDPYLGYDWEGPVSETYGYGGEDWIKGYLEPLLDVQSEAFDEGYFDYAGFWDAHSDWFAPYDPGKELTRRYGSDSTLEGIGMQAVSDLSDISLAGGRSGAVGGDYLKNFEDALRYAELKAVGENKLMMNDVRGFRNDWEEDIAATWANMLDLDIFSDESDFYVDRSLNQDPPSGNDPNVPGGGGGTGGGTGGGSGGGGFDLCQDENGNWIDCPDEDPPDPPADPECPIGSYWDEELQDCVYPTPI